MIASGNGCKMGKCGEIGQVETETELKLKYIWYKRDAWTVESGLIGGRMKDGIYKV